MESCFGKGAPLWTSDGVSAQFVAKLPFFLVDFLNHRKPLSSLAFFSLVVLQRLSLSATATEGDLRLLHGVRLFLASVGAFPCGVDWLSRVSAQRETLAALLARLEEGAFLLLTRAAALPQAQSGNFSRGLSDAASFLCSGATSALPAEEKASPAGGGGAIFGGLVGRLLAWQRRDASRKAFSCGGFCKRADCASCWRQGLLEGLLQRSAEKAFLTEADVEGAWSSVDAALARVTPSEREIIAAVSVAATAVALRLKTRIAELIPMAFKTKRSPPPGAEDAAGGGGWCLDVTAILSLENLTATSVAGAEAAAALLAYSGASGCELFHRRNSRSSPCEPLTAAKVRP